MAIDLTRYRDFGSKVFRPSRPKLAKVRALLAPWLEREIAEPAASDALAVEAWEQCAALGFVPMEWLDHPSRLFEQPRTAWKRTSERRRGPEALRPERNASPLTYTTHPPTVRACVAVAADPESLLSVERCAREWLSLLTADPPAWIGAPSQNAPIAWQLDGLGPEQESPAVFDAPYNRVGWAGWKLAEQGFLAAIAGRAPDGWPIVAARVAHWECCCQYGAQAVTLEVPVDRAEPDGPRRTVNIELGTLREQCDLLLSIFELGYAIEVSSVGRTTAHLTMHGPPGLRLRVVSEALAQQH